MAKNYKLNNPKKPVADGRFYINGGFFHRFVCTRTTNIIIILLQIASLVMVTIFGLVIGVMGAVVSMMDVYPEAHSYVQAGIILWLVSSSIYVIGEFVLFLGYSRVASIVHGVATVLLISMYYTFGLAEKTINIESVGPKMVYIPCILILVITVAIAMLVHIPLWLDKKAEQDRAVAPSILSDDEEV